MGPVNKDRFRELGSGLDITPKDINTMKKEKFKERFIYPITAACVALLSAFLGWFFGRFDERDVSRDTGKEYPFTTSTRYTLTGCFGITALGIGMFIGILKARNKEGKEKMKIFGAIIIMVAAAIIIFFVTYRFSQPVDYYSGAIKYGVYSREGKP